MKVRKAVIPVAGLGTRFLPATKTVPKELLPIVDIPTVQYVVQEAVDAGIQEVIFVTGRGKDGIEDHFDEAPELNQVLEERGQNGMVETLRRIAEMIEVVSVRQKRPLGLGHAVLCARDLVGNEPFAVLLADDLIDAEVPCVGQMLEVFESKKESVVALMKVPREEVHRYGVIKGEAIEPRVYAISDMVEKPAAKDAPSQLAIIGRYVLRPEIFSVLEKLPPGAGGEIQLTDGLARLVRERGVYGYEFVGERYDVGDKFGFVRATVAYALKRPELRDQVKEYLRTVVD
ncbi:MAG TPA: UTP--glucose-1-phosphate uridylyltransferase GalU [Candidatus Acidoferrales bacterium]|nr:UTP--glucose-1-phosphate uridylyltransferase GalU [Candidatus Acidoferrales bacterium]